MHLHSPHFIIMEKIIIKFNTWRNGSFAWRKPDKNSSGGCMWERDILDKFATKWQIKLNVCPQRVSGNFIILYDWIREIKEFNKNSKQQRLNFWKDLEETCKTNKISFEKAHVL